MLGHFEKATTFFGGESYTTMSLVLPIIDGLIENVSVTLQDSSVIQKFKKKLWTELKEKFNFNKLSPQSLPVLCAALDPRFHDLPFLATDDERSSVKDTLLRQLAKMEQKKQTGVETAVCCGTATKRVKPEDDTLRGPAAKRAHVLSQIIRPRVKKETTCPGAELDRFQHEDITALESDPLVWWKLNEQRFPAVAQLAKMYLAVPCSSVPCEHVFSASGLVVNSLRSSLTPENVDALVFLNKTIPWLEQQQQHRTPSVPPPATTATAASSVTSPFDDESESDDEVPKLPQLPTTPNMATRDSASDSDY